MFRVDNPHTKPFPFWEWAIGELKAQHPELIFLAEAFTRPKIMHRLAKLGFTQSYTYFTWRNTKQELTEYFTELAHGPGREYFRPNVWPNTPDILTEYLQHGGRPAFVGAAAARRDARARATASTGRRSSCSSACRASPAARSTSTPRSTRSARWDLERADSLRYLIARVNAIRRENPALQDDGTLTFVTIDNDQLIAYVKATRRRLERAAHRRQPRSAPPPERLGRRRSRRASASKPTRRTRCTIC